jgi:hypothetical protein
MKTRLSAFILIEFGVLMLGYSYITFITNLIWSILLSVVAYTSSDPMSGTLDQPLNLTAMQFTTTSHHFMPAVTGAVALVSGIVLLLATFLHGLTASSGVQSSAAAMKLAPEP